MSAPMPDEDVVHLRGGILPTLCTAGFFGKPCKNTDKPSEVDCPRCLGLMHALGISKDDVR